MNCTARVTPNTPHYCAKSRQICATPYTCSHACRLITDNSDGSNPHQRAAPAASHAVHLLRWLALTAVIYSALYLMTGLTPF